MALRADDLIQAKTLQFF